jgi:hypothetical protein
VAWWCRLQRWNGGSRGSYHIWSPWSRLGKIYLRLPPRDLSTLTSHILARITHSSSNQSLGLPNFFRCHGRPRWVPKCWIHQTCHGHKAIPNGTVHLSSPPYALCTLLTPLMKQMEGIGTLRPPQIGPEFKDDAGISSKYEHGSGFDLSLHTNFRHLNYWDVINDKPIETQCKFPHPHVNWPCGRNCLRIKSKGGLEIVVKGQWLELQYVWQ